MIFTLQNEKYNVPYMQKINPTHGKHCKYFNSDSQKNTDSLLVNVNKAPEQTNTEYEVEEIAKVVRKIVYINAENSQKCIKKSLVEHLKEGYKIKCCILRKTDNFLTIGKKESKEVEVTICVE